MLAIWVLAGTRKAGTAYHATWIAICFASRFPPRSDTGPLAVENDVGLKTNFSTVICEEFCSIVWAIYQDTSPRLHVSLLSTTPRIWANHAPRFPFRRFSHTLEALRSHEKIPNNKKPLRAWHPSLQIFCPPTASTPLPHLRRSSAFQKRRSSAEMGEAQDPLFKVGEKFISNPASRERLLTVLLPNQKTELLLSVADIVLERILELLVFLCGAVVVFSQGTPRQKRSGFPRKRSLSLFFIWLPSLLPSPLCYSQTSGFGGALKCQLDSHCTLFRHQTFSTSHCL